MSKAGALLAARILAAINDLNTVVKRAIQGWERTKTRNDDYYLDGVALNLHGFYSGLERGLRKDLESYLGFRHVVRNVYTYHLNPDKLEALVTQAQAVFIKTKNEIVGFCKLLQDSK